MFAEAALLAWSALALLWWGISWWLVQTCDEAPPPEEKRADDGTARSLTLFKPLPALGSADFEDRGIASFLAQLGPQDELLLGVHEADRARVQASLAGLRAKFPAAPLRVVWRREPDTLANPKVAWLQLLADHARGELWLWSDADIVAPPGFVRSARDEYAAGAARLVTWPYVVREIVSPPALLDALFVNAEFFPGVLLLRRLGTVDFGLGAGLLFARADFEANVSWRELGAALADDFLLGQKLRPVRVGRAVLATAAEVRTWRDAVLHYLRWSKTVRWNRPGGTAARIIVLPLLGWLAFIIGRPQSPLGWLGLAGLMQIDVLAAVFICCRLGCRLRLRDIPALQAWSFGRALVWVACWLPWPVTWRGRRWRGPISASKAGR